MKKQPINKSEVETYLQGLGFTPAPLGNAWVLGVYRVRIMQWHIDVYMYDSHLFKVKSVTEYSIDGLKRAVKANPSLFNS